MCIEYKIEIENEVEVENEADCSVHMYLSNMAQVEAGRETCVFSV